MSSSLDDVAQLAGVSPATVSRALRGLPSVAVTTRDRVRAAAAELGYVSSPSASSLASGRTATVGVVVPYLDRWYFSTVIAGAEKVLREAGMATLLYNIGDTAGRTRFFAELPLRKRVDAVLVLSLPLTEPETQALTGLDLPVVSVGQVAEGIPMVGIDDYAATRSAIRLLAQLGHRDIAFIGQLDPVPLGFPTPRARLRAYQDAMAEFELGEPMEADGHFTVSGGETAMTTLLTGAKRPTAVFAASDEMAFGALRGLRKTGLRVPEDVSVVGFDGHELTGLVDLTTVAQPVADQGATAARLLLDWLGDGTPPPSKTLLKTRLVLNGSTGPVPAA
ncbi:DNA-binding transcriptional regulator, LacI/PurR family [Amycolatopsis xylanica]|uniref:DNA-binding transcriptional regulator, LacI/PurR family n=1 Tax=Amycolatopsis xylanica TaxID=589385 RepID=A0A1H3SC46_9PSEU|nr:LacI family DNA-binding transcriptional regulator [Amycolatopsis xylanica]SDZ35125.1 DNA-binding transcriptional regulator, LacI/PurR family [Amycolatopsis xylanica]